MSDLRVLVLSAFWGEYYEIVLTCPHCPDWSKRLGDDVTIDELEYFRSAHYKDDNHPTVAG